jgi:hypothetical protein
MFTKDQKQIEHHWSKVLGMFVKQPLGHIWHKTYLHNLLMNKVLSMFYVKLLYQRVDVVSVLVEIFFVTAAVKHVWSLTYQTYYQWLPLYTDSDFLLYDIAP